MLGKRFSSYVTRSPISNWFDFRHPWAANDTLLTGTSWMRPALSVVFVGFDSAWTDKPSAPGAICSVTYDDGRFTRFEPPRLASFAQALDFIRSVHAAGPTLVAIDQPTIVPNATGMRPVDRQAASLISWLGGGVQPANRGKMGMFDDASPIWRFLRL